MIQPVNLNHHALGVGVLACLHFTSILWGAKRFWWFCEEKGKFVDKQIEWNEQSEINEQKWWPPGEQKEIEQIAQPCPIITNTSNGANGYSPNRIHTLFTIGTCWKLVQHEKISSGRIPMKKYTNQTNRFCTKPASIYIGLNGFNDTLLPLNLGPDFGQVLQSSGLNCSLKLDWGISMCGWQL